MSDGGRLHYAADVKLERGEDEDTTPFLCRKDSWDSIDRPDIPLSLRKRADWMRAVAFGIVLGLGLALLVAFIYPRRSLLPAGQTNPDCLDPYLQPGYIRRENGTFRTSWHPYTPKNLLSSHPGSYMDPIVYSELLSQPDRQNDPRLAFAHNRTILLVGESLDRDNLLSFCSQHAGTTIIYARAHLAYACHVPNLNLTLAMWFTTGMRGNNTEWFWPTMPQPSTFEDRWREHFLPTLPLIGDPSLVVVASHFWDLMFLDQKEARRRKSLRLPTQRFQLGEADLLWQRRRVAEMMELVRRTFPAARVMWRLGTRWKSDKEAYFGDANLGVFRMNQSLKALMGVLKVPIFPWAALLNGETDYKDPIHVKDGHAASLFTTMALHYLQTAVTGIC